MGQGNIIGYEINEKTCQISFYNDQQLEPETLEVDTDNYQIPLIIGKLRDTWAYGKEAKRLVTIKEGFTVTRLLERALAGEKIEFGEESYDAVWLLSKFVQMSLQAFPQIDGIVFTVPELSEELAKLLRGIAVRMNVDKQHIFIQDYKESFCHYMFNQPKELWQYESALFYCDQDVIRAFMLRELKTGYRKGKESFVTVDKVAEAQMEELESVYPVLNVDKAKAADEHFKSFIQSVFDKKVVSSVFLTGDGFENNWYPNSLRVLCNGRRAFMGNNLYSKGACYTAMQRSMDLIDGPVYLDETKMTEQICLKMRSRGEEGWYPLVAWGSHWYESDRQCEVLLEDNQDIEIHIESLVTGKLRVETVSLEGLPERKNYALRLRIRTMFTDERTCHITFEDVGFGEFFPPTGFFTEKVIELGGSNGQFNSLS